MVSLTAFSDNFIGVSVMEDASVPFIAMLLVVQYFIDFARNNILSETYTVFCPTFL